MRDLQRLTSEYVESEDRIRVSGELESDEIVVMWFSQRLLTRLLPHLFLWLEKQSKQNIPLEIEQSFAQEAARETLKTEIPVKNLGESNQWLVETVDLTPSKEFFVMSFKSASGKSEKLSLQPVALRQWLGIIHALWALAEWPDNVWPEWISQKAQDPKQSPQSKLH